MEIKMKQTNISINNKSVQSAEFQNAEDLIQSFFGLLLSWCVVSLIIFLISHLLMMEHKRYDQARWIGSCKENNTSW
jgi:hypothetical protein